MKPRSLNFTNASTIASATLGVKIPPRNRCGVGHFNPFNTFGGMSWGWWGEAGGVRAAMLRRIPSLFLNDA